MWSGSMQSFIQEPISQNSTAKGRISRSNECRLLLLTQAEHHIRWPICQWTPSGTTDIKYTEMNVHLHTGCSGHGLRYAGWKWVCQNGGLVHQPCYPNLIPAHTSALGPLSPVSINYEDFHYEEESASENYTRNIFGWLRFGCYPPRNEEYMNMSGLRSRSPMMKDRRISFWKEPRASFVSIVCRGLDKSQYLNCPIVERIDRYIRS
jgi:hypothetical protein